ncbi:hypothetical protein [Stappia sp.]|uniref:hypothetical protein n=1 Tax=Stappia sp. TaxID=1870903 RepID=UPI003A9A145F
MSNAPHLVSADVAGALPARSRCASVTRVSFAEMRVLAVGLRMRAPGFGGCAPDRDILPEAERADRLAVLVGLWAGGCRNVVDEVLFRDIAARHPELAGRLRSRLRRRHAAAPRFPHSSGGTGIGRP